MVPRKRAWGGEWIKEDLEDSPENEDNGFFDSLVDPSDEIDCL